MIWFYGVNLSVAVAVGFIALFGMAIETAMLMTIYLNEAMQRLVAEKGNSRDTITPADLFLKIPFLTTFCLCFAARATAQNLLPLDSVLDRIERLHPALQATDARGREFDVVAKGAVTLPPPQVGGGMWMTAYNPARWSEGMGAVMVSAQQMFPNRKMQQAEGRYMSAMSGMQAAEKGVMRNMLFAEAKTAYFDWLVLEKKIAVLEESKRALRLLIESAEQRFQYNREKLGSIYKAKTELADLDRMQAMYSGEIRRQRAMLATLMQLDPASVFEIDTLMPSGPALVPPLPDTSRIAARSDFQAIETNFRIARLEQEWQRSKLKPEYGLRFDHMFAFGGQPWQFSLMGMVTVPIAPWANKDIKAKIEGIEHRLTAFELDKAALANQIRGALSEQLVMMQTLQTQIALRRRHHPKPTQTFSEYPARLGTEYRRVVYGARCLAGTKNEPPGPIRPAATIASIKSEL
ncbi:MAG: TolC family protein [Saprospirales bacterium]|nr:TolC family protein [Saprospirales bacterium]